MPAIFVRPGTSADIAPILGIIQSAREFLASQHINQWQGTYPDRAAVEEDIANETNRVLIVDGQVAGTASLIKGPDPYYKRIDGAGWIGDRDYMMIHRFAIDGHYRGQQLARFFMTALTSEAYALGYRDLRIDTHAQNKIMQHVILGAGYEFRGIVYLDEPVPERNAYQLVLEAAL
ncbi:GNAT family N-acetyltransferase [Lacticaseibacillus jixiensis]|uniref:GNAT family N-acetyltransferase n=1 Tax=Lacticaseibacillus jixiensis TaxID=3231926 RepID=UPI0036F3A1E0